VIIWVEKPDKKAETARIVMHYMRSVNKIVSKVAYLEICKPHFWQFAAIVK